MATLLSLRTSVRDRLDEAVAIHWSDAQLNSWINEGARDIARRTETLQDKEVIAVLANTREYTIPASVLRIHRAEFKVTGDNNIYPLEFRAFNAMDSIWWTQQGVTTSTPLLYTVWGSNPNNKVVIYPVPAQAGALTLFVYRLPVVAEEDGDEVEVPGGWDDLCVDYAEYHALRRDRDPRWQEAKTLYEERIADFYDLSRHWVDQGGIITPDSPIGPPAWLVYDQPNW